MRDLAHMLGALVAGMVNTLVATKYGGVGCGAVVAGATGWVMAQYDHNYQRVRGLGDGGG